MPHKPKSPYPPLIKRIARKLLSDLAYRQHFGRHEDGSNHLWCQIVASLVPGQVILDIGAFNGEYAFLAQDANPSVVVYAFEPNPISAQDLRGVCKQRGIELVECAIAEYDGVVSFAIARAQSRIVEQVPDPSPKEIVEVYAVTLDSWVNINDVAPALIKIDTEGAEAGILRSASTILNQFEPIVLCEVLSDEAGKDVMKAVPFNYLYYHIDENSGRITRMAKITRSKWRNHNWLLLPAAKKSRLIQLAGIQK